MEEYYADITFHGEFTLTHVLRKRNFVRLVFCNKNKQKMFEDLEDKFGQYKKWKNYIGDKFNLHSLEENGYIYQVESTPIGFDFPYGNVGSLKVGETKIFTNPLELY